MIKKEDNYINRYNSEGLESRIREYINKKPNNGDIRLAIFKVYCEYNDEGYDLNSPILIILDKDNNEVIENARFLIPSYEEQSEFYELTEQELVEIMPDTLIVKFNQNIPSSIISNNDTSKYRKLSDVEILDIVYQWNNTYKIQIYKILIKKYPNVKFKKVIAKFNCEYNDNTYDINPLVIALDKDFNEYILDSYTIIRECFNDQNELYNSIADFSFDPDKFLDIELYTKD